MWERSEDCGDVRHGSGCVGFAIIQQSSLGELQGTWLFIPGGSKGMTFQCSL